MTAERPILLGMAVRPTSGRDGRREPASGQDTGAGALRRPRAAAEPVLPLSGLPPELWTATREALIAATPASLYVISADGRLLAANATLASRLGMSLDDIPGTDAAETAHPDDWAHVAAELAAALGGEMRRYIARGRRTDGSFFHASIVNAPITVDGEVVAVAGVAHDIDDLIGARASLAEAGERLRSTLDGIGDVIAFVDADWRLTFLNAAAGRLLGGDADALVGEELWSLQLPDPEGEAALREAMATRQRRVSRRYDEGLGRWMEVAAFPAGDLLGIQVRDVTELEEARRRTQDDTRLVHARSMLMDESDDAIFMRGLGDVVEYANAAAARMFDAGDPSDLVGRRLRDVLGLSDDDVRATEAALGRDGLWRGDLVLHAPTGEEYITQNHWSTVTGPDGAPDAVFCIISDVTERRRESELLVRTQRMESIGTLASGIAHDLNNVLTPLLLSTQLLAAEETDPKRSRLLEGMLQTVERGSDMIRQVLTFARGVEGERVVVDLSVLAKRFAEFCHDTLPRDIRVDAAVDDGLAVLGDPTQLLQVLMNLATNARDAMPDGGHLSLRARGVGERVVIEVRDTGSGMSREVLDHVFEPFYTTKEVGRGTGLGLPVSQAIARTHGGSLDASSTPGRGTTFRLELPLAGPCPAEETTSGRERLPDLGGLRVLVVDDQEDIARTATLVVEAAGGVALVAHDATEALAVLAAEPVDVVVTDLVMPGFSGRRFLDALEADHARMPVVTMSGVPEQGAVAAQREIVKAALDKPFTTERLLDAIRLAAGRT